MLPKVRQQIIELPKHDTNNHLRFLVTYNASAVPPPILWAQRTEMLIVTIAVECKDEVYEFTEDSLHFTAVGVNTDKAYDVTLNFAGKIVPDEVTTKKTAQCNLQFQIPRVSGDIMRRMAIYGG